MIDVFFCECLFIIVVVCYHRLWIPALWMFVHHRRCLSPSFVNVYSWRSALWMPIHSRDLWTFIHRRFLWISSLVNVYLWRSVNVFSSLSLNVFSVNVFFVNASFMNAACECFFIVAAACGHASVRFLWMLFLWMFSLWMLLLWMLFCECFFIVAVVCGCLFVIYRLINRITLTVN